MKNDIPNIPSHLHISHSNLLQYEFPHFVIKFYHKISLFKINLRQLLLQGNFWKISCSLPTENTGLPQFFPKFFSQLYFKNINFCNKNQKVPIMLAFMTSKLSDDWQIFDKQYHIFQKSKSYENIKYRHRYWWGSGIYYSCILLVYPLDHYIY